MVRQIICLWGLTAHCLATAFDVHAAEALRTSSIETIWQEDMISRAQEKDLPVARIPKTPQDTANYNMFFTQITIEEAPVIEAPSVLAPEPNRLATRFAADFAKADQFHLAPLSAMSKDGLAFFTASRASLGPLLTLPTKGEEVGNHHLIQNFAETDYLIWPDISASALPPIILQNPLTAQITYRGQPEISVPFAGHITLSFIDHEATITLESQTDRLGLSFSLADWQNSALIQSQGTLIHRGQNYQADVTLGHTNLPDPALFGFFATEGLAEDMPASGQFQNFELDNR